MFEVIFGTRGEGVKGVIDAVNNTASALGSQIPEFTVKTLMEKALEVAKKNTPGTGRVRESWRFTDFGNIAILFNEIAETPEGVMLLQILEGGSKPHTIVPKKAKFLHFFLANGKGIFTKKVEHPGTKPYDMITGAASKVEELLKEMIEAAEESAVDTWEGT